MNYILTSGAMCQGAKSISHVALLPACTIGKHFVSSRFYNSINTSSLSLYFAKSPSRKVRVLTIQAVNVSYGPHTQYVPNKPFQANLIKILGILWTPIVWICELYRLEYFAVPATDRNHSQESIAIV